MKNVKTNHAKWALGATTAIASLSTAQAQVRVILNHDFATSLSGVDFGGLGQDAGQWSGGVNVTANSASAGWNPGIGTYGARASFATVGGAGMTNIASIETSSMANWAIGTAVLGVQNAGVGPRTTSYVSQTWVNRTDNAGLIAWDLADGTEGWLKVTSKDAWLGNWSTGTHSIVAEYFVFDENFVGVTGGRTGGNLDHGGDEYAFDNATVVPEPSSLALLGLGAAGVIGRRKRQAA